MLLFRQTVSTLSHPWASTYYEISAPMMNSFLQTFCPLDNLAHAGLTAMPKKFLLTLLLQLWTRQETHTQG